MTHRKNKLTLLISAITILLCVAVFGGTKASAASYNYSNYLMDDAIIRASNSMTAQGIQNFLTQEGSGLAVFSDVENCGSASGANYAYYATYYSCGQSRSAAQIISDASKAYGINPEVILATLQKEQSLVTTPNPTSSQLTYAMGYGCPDSGSCTYPGFFNQIDNATWQLRTDMELGSGNNWWGYTPASYPCSTATRYYSAPLKPGNNVTFIDDSGVSYTSFVIPNMATASLYCYTPHVYNNPQGLYGLPTFGTTGSYYSGSYYFVYYFNRWFDINSLILNNVTMTTITQPVTNPARGQTVTYTVSFTNNLLEKLVLNDIFIVGRAGSINGTNRDFGHQGQITLQPGIPQQFTFSTTIQDLGTVYMWPAMQYQGNYIQYNNWGTMIVSHAPNFTLSQPLTISPTTIYAGHDVTFSVVLKNNEAYPINYDALGIPVRYYDSYNYDAAWVGPGVIAPGGVITLTGIRTIDKPGPFTYWVSWDLAGQYTALSSMITTNAVNTIPSFTMNYITTPDTYPALGEQETVSYTLTNNLPVSITLPAVGMVGRLDNPYTGANKDPGWVGPETFTAGQTKTYTFVYNMSALNRIYVWPAFLFNNTYTQYNSWGFMITPHSPNITISSPLLFNSGNPITTGQTIPVTVTIKNNESHSLNYAAAGIPIRFYGTYNYDTAWVGSGTLGAAGQSGDSLTLTGLINFNKSGPYTAWVSLLFGQNYQTIGNVVDITAP